MLWGLSPYYGVMNVGCRPTFGDGLHVSYEVHLLDFHENLYNEELTVEVCFYIRQEMKFSNLNELKGQIYKDVAQVRKQFGMLLISKELEKEFEGRVVSWS